MKVTAQLTTADDGRKYYALMIDGQTIPNQTSVKLEQIANEPDSFTATFIGKVDENGIMQICDI